MDGDAVVDAELVRRAVDGERDALTSLLRAAAPRLRASLDRDLPARVAAVLSVDDVLQQTFTDVFVDIHRFVPTGDGAFESWVSTLARNNLRDALRMIDAARRGGDRRPVQVGGDASIDGLLEAVAGRSRSSPTRVATRREEADRLLEAIDRLPGDYATVVRSYDLAGESIEDVATAISRSVGATFLVRHRAHRRLREWLARALDDAPEGTR